VSITISWEEIVFKTRPQMETCPQERKTMVLALQKAFEMAPPKPQNFPNPFWQTLQAHKAQRKTFFGEDRPSISDCPAPVLMVYKIQGKET